MSVNRLIAGETEATVNVKTVMSIVSQDLLTDGARPRLISEVDQGTDLLTPKLVGFHGQDLSNIKWAIYLDKQLLMNDKHHLTASLQLALLHFELVRLVN